MATLGPWDPVGSDEVVALFAGAPFRWWLCGGHALEHYVGESWRDHDDIDVGMLRRDVPHLARQLAGWDIHLAAAGVLSPWDGRVPWAERSENNLWCRRSPDEAWCLDLTVSEGDDDRWIHRRHEHVQVPWAEAVRFDRDVPYLAPELQLSFKADRPRPKDDLDAAVVIPHVGPEAQAWLRQFLDSSHPWQALLP